MNIYQMEFNMNTYMNPSERIFFILCLSFDVQQAAQQLRTVRQNIERYHNLLQNTKLYPIVLSRLSGQFLNLFSLKEQIKLQRIALRALQRTHSYIYPRMESMCGRTNSEYQANSFDRYLQGLSGEDRIKALDIVYWVVANHLREAREMLSVLDVYLQEELCAAADVFNGVTVDEDTKIFDEKKAN
ncbi:MAG: hypothetical protein LBO64_04675 [Desulfovibrio sp.]|jgi:conjugal transfer/entry exclusion protein|nr:hypothetical protein [Desulfovibrio sp.]